MAWLTYAFVGRFVLFVTFFCFLAAWEGMRPWRPWVVARRLRWGRHLGLSGISFLCVRLVFPFFAVFAAFKVQEKGIGFLNQSEWLLGIKVGIGVVGLDFIVYLQHRMLHHIKWLWRFHQVHHLDKEVDVSTALRFHPVEEVILMGTKIIGVAFLGVPPIGVFIFEVWLGAAFLFTHLNIRLSGLLEQRLRYFIVTPGMHRVHHSDNFEEYTRNFGFCLSVWDKIFGTYIKAPSRTGERKLIFGLEGYRDPKYQTLPTLLCLPFRPKYLRIRSRRLRKTHMQ